MTTDTQPEQREKPTGLSSLKSAEGLSDTDSSDGKARSEEHIAESHSRNKQRDRSGNTLRQREVQKQTSHSEFQQTWREKAQSTGMGVGGGVKGLGIELEGRTLAYNVRGTGSIFSNSGPKMVEYLPRTLKAWAGFSPQESRTSETMCLIPTSAN